jgi:hypothetical protein
VEEERKRPLIEGSFYVTNLQMLSYKTDNSKYSHFINNLKAGEKNEPGNVIS